jgi:hypothetical protein
MDSEKKDGSADLAAVHPPHPSQETVMMAPISQAHPLRRWFAGLIEDTFNVQVGVADPSLVDYLTDLLTEFIHMERINLLADGSGRKIEDVAEMMTEAQFRTNPSNFNRRLAVHRHIGDFTLFWTGVYPEQLRRMRRRRDRDALLSYFEQGKRSYSIASDLCSDDAVPPSALLRRLSHEFERCVYGLGLVRQRWEHTSAAPFYAVNPPMSG